MFNILDQYEPIYFQNDYFNFFQGSKLKILASLEKRETQNFYIKRSPADQKFFLILGPSSF